MISETVPFPPYEKLIKKNVLNEQIDGKNRNCLEIVTSYCPMDLKIGIHGLQTNTPRRFFRISIFVPHLGEIGSGSRACPPFFDGRSRRRTKVNHKISEIYHFSAL